jgi:hypothetical protein
MQQLVRYFFTVFHSDETAVGLFLGKVDEHPQQAAPGLLEIDQVITHADDSLFYQLQQLQCDSPMFADARHSLHTIVCQKKNGHLPIFLIVQAKLTCAAMIATMLLRACLCFRACSGFRPPELFKPALRRPSLTTELYGIARYVAMKNTAVRHPATAVRPSSKF